MHGLMATTGNAAVPKIQDKGRVIGRAMEQAEPQDAGMLRVIGVDRSTWI